jgi:DNA-binding transcriptional LysR family regulator
VRFCLLFVQKCRAMPDWSDLRFLLEVARTGTLAAAGRKLGVDNTTVGRRLSALERDLGAKLFARTPDGLVLTPAGEAIRTAGEEMEQAVLRGEQRAQGADRKLSGLVRVATTEMLGEVVVRPARGSGFAGHDVIGYDAGIRDWRLGQMGGEPVRDARVVLRVNSALMLLQAVRMGIGIGPLPCFLAAPDDSLERVPSGAPAELDEVWLVVHADVQRTSRVRAVIEALEKRMADIAPELSAA